MFFFNLVGYYSTTSDQYDDVLLIAAKEWIWIQHCLSTQSWPAHFWWSECISLLKLFIPQLLFSSITGAGWITKVEASAVLKHRAVWSCPEDTITIVCVLGWLHLLGGASKSIHYAQTLVVFVNMFIHLLQDREVPNCSNPDCTKIPTRLDSEEVIHCVVILCHILGKNNVKRTLYAGTCWAESLQVQWSWTASNHSKFNPFSKIHARNRQLQLYTGIKQDPIEVSIFI